MVKALPAHKTNRPVLLYHLEELRACTERSDEEIAELLGFSVETWHAYAEGRAVPSLEDTVRISALFGAPISFLLSPPADAE